MAKNTFDDQKTFRAAVRTANSDVVRDAAILNTTVASARISAYGPYHAQNTKLGLLMEANRLAYNVAHPDT